MVPSINHHTESISMRKMLYCEIVEDNIDFDDGLLSISKSLRNDNVMLVGRLYAERIEMVFVDNASKRLMANCCRFCQAENFATKFPIIRIYVDILMFHSFLRLFAFSTIKRKYEKRMKKNAPANSFSFPKREKLVTIWWMVFAFGLIQFMSFGFRDLFTIHFIGRIYRWNLKPAYTQTHYKKKLKLEKSP